jgi:serine/threonine protein kinase
MTVFKYPDMDNTNISQKTNSTESSIISVSQRNVDIITCTGTRFPNRTQWIEKKHRVKSTYEREKTNYIRLNSRTKESDIIPAPELVFFDDSKITLCIEIIDGITIQEWYSHEGAFERNDAGFPPTEYNRIIMMKDIIEIYKKCSQSGFVHNDMKADNIMIRRASRDFSKIYNNNESKNPVILIDFELSKMIKVVEMKIENYTSTIEDIFNYGIICSQGDRLYYGNFMHISPEVYFVMAYAHAHQTKISEYISFRNFKNILPGMNLWALGQLALHMFTGQKINYDSLIISLDTHKRIMYMDYDFAVVTFTSYLDKYINTFFMRPDIISMIPTCFIGIIKIMLSPFTSMRPNIVDLYNDIEKLTNSFNYVIGDSIYYTINQERPPIDECDLFVKNTSLML